jgi:hypothetical protein
MVGLRVAIEVCQSNPLMKVGLEQNHLFRQKLLPLARPLQSLMAWI